MRNNFDCKSTYMKVLLSLDAISRTGAFNRCETLGISVGTLINISIREVCEKGLFRYPSQLFYCTVLDLCRKLEGIDWLLISAHWFCCLVSPLVFERHFCKQMYRTILLIRVHGRVASSSYGRWTDQWLIFGRDVVCIHLRVIQDIDITPLNIDYMICRLILAFVVTASCSEHFHRIYFLF